MPLKTQGKKINPNVEMARKNRMVVIFTPTGICVVPKLTILCISLLLEFQN